MFMLSFIFLMCYSTDTMNLMNGPIKDSQNESLVSAGNRFELGFFTPEGSSPNKRYLGIWYYKVSPKIVVWVANRDKPLLNTNGVFVVSNDGQLKVTDEKSGDMHWRANVSSRLQPSVTREVTLMDSGNLVLSDVLYSRGVVLSRTHVWESFLNPTDTFLPGMMMTLKMKLTSWTSQDDPKQGEFAFLQLDTKREEYPYMIQRGVSKATFWKSSSQPNPEYPDSFGGISPIAHYFLTNFTRVSSTNTSNSYRMMKGWKGEVISPYVSNYSNSRLVMSFNGQIQFYMCLHSVVNCSIKLSPSDPCHVYEVCGEFGVCNSKNAVLCRCLPGFQPKNQSAWDSGNFKDGCVSRSVMPCNKNYFGNDFLHLKNIKVGKPGKTLTDVEDDEKCKEHCSDNCNCTAYLFTTEGRRPSCWIWTDGLENIQEDNDNDAESYINVRVELSKTETFKKSCKACGANIIPYPLSTSSDCGDPLYSDFTCDTNSGEVFFQALHHKYRVTNIDPVHRKFTVQLTEELGCTASVQMLNQSLGYTVSRGCSSLQSSIVPNMFPFFSRAQIIELEIQWNKPLRPPCKTTSDCDEIVNSDCNDAKEDGSRRCTCLKHFTWDSESLTCIYEGTGGRIEVNQALHLYDSERSIVDFMQTGLLCVQEDPEDRPTMSNAVFMLGSETATIPNPKQPAFVIRKSLSSTGSSSKGVSINEFTATPIWSDGENQSRQRLIHIQTKVETTPPPPKKNRPPNSRSLGLSPPEPAKFHPRTLPAAASPVRVVGAATQSQWRRRPSRNFWVFSVQNLYMGIVSISRKTVEKKINTSLRASTSALYSVRSHITSLLLLLQITSSGSSIDSYTMLISKSNRIFILVIQFLCLFVKTNFSVRTGGDTISSNQTLNGFSTIVSAGGVFVLGFFSPGNNENYYVGIWYQVDPSRSVVWIANREKPVSFYSHLRISDGNLVLFNEDEVPIWSTNVNSSSSCVQAVIKDDGNLILINCSNPTKTLWKSFDYPSHTFLPGNQIGYNKVTKTHRVLTSWKNSKDPLPGLYSFHLNETDNSYILIWNRSITYWSSGPWSGHNFRSVRSTLEISYNLMYESNGYESYFTYSVRNTTMISQVFLDVSGQLKLFNWLFASKKWELSGSHPGQHCEVYAFCGANSLCDHNYLPFCRCLTGFTPKFQSEWDLKEYSNGCIRERALQCGNDSLDNVGGDRFLEIPYVNLPKDNESLRTGAIQDCASTCLSMCSCIAYAHNNSGCLFWTEDLLNVKQLTANDSNSKSLYIRLSASEFEDRNNKGRMVLKSKILYVILGIIAAIVLISSIACYGYYQRRKQSKRKGEYRHMTFLQLPSIINALSYLYVKFCGQDAQAWKLWKDNKALDLMDARLSESCNRNEFMRCVNVALLCVQESSSDRPTMPNVVFMLGNETTFLSNPKQPAFVSWISPSISTSPNKPSSSVNKLTTTLVQDNSLSHLFEETVQVTTDDLTYRLDPREIDTQEPLGKVLLGKIICKGKLGRAAIAGTLKMAWSSFKGWSWREDDNGILHFTSASKEDAWNVLHRCAWIICGALLVIMSWPSWLSHSEVKFNKSPIWVGLSGIPHFYWNKSNLEELVAKHEEPVRWPFAPNLPKWFEEWIIQKRLTVDQTFKQQRKLSNSVKDLPATDEEKVSCFSMVSIPGVGEVCPFEDTATLVIRKASVNNLLSEPSSDQPERDIASGLHTHLFNRSVVPPFGTNITSVGLGPSGMDHLHQNSYSSLLGKSFPVLPVDLTFSPSSLGATSSKRNRGRPPTYSSGNATGTTNPQDLSPKPRNAATIQKLKDLIQKSNPEILVFSEVRLTYDKFTCLMSKIYFTGLFYVAPLGSAGAEDTITLKSLLSDEIKDSLVSAGEVFELGFFTPNGSYDSRRYIGIWYYKSNPHTVVWVANRDNPLSGTGGVFAISDDGNLKVMDKSGQTYWSTKIPSSTQMNRVVKLMDSGNLVLSNIDPEDNSMSVLWQSFENPTDTFLPGMMLSEDLVLTSWTSNGDPGSGNFTFQQDQEKTNQVIILKRSVKYWNSGVSGRFISLNEMPPAMLYLLSNFTSKTVRNDSIPYLTASLYKNTRLVMSVSGQIQYLRWDSQMISSPIWAEPRDKCSVYNACGNFGSCNSKNNLVCKCLPGFKPISPENGNTGDYSKGCVRRTTTCQNNSEIDTFLDLKMMKVGNPDSQFNAKTEEECKVECLNNCQCQAYLFEEAEMSHGSSACWIWSEELNNLQEEYATGRNLHVRVAVTDIELTARSCEVCGTNLIPYPLSIDPKCGDPLYYSFHCNNSNGQVSFETNSGTFRVTSINPNTQSFFIRLEDLDNCKDSFSEKFLKLNQSLPFTMRRGCNANLGNFSSDMISKHGVEVEIAWKQPLEPPCSSSVDCENWPNSACNTAQDGKNRCLCNKKFKWDNLNMKCRGNGYNKTIRRGKMNFALIIIIILITIAVVAEEAMTRMGCFSGMTVTEELKA
ncbi:hypothetical protein G4B88_018527 [Cannabis sativa]|uniref:non-specific serine/threonine protein kinase n=1 Tax=Cannabis sativa TaxID=3483 RepID=A0A7J6HGD3_CANSA|nr:hypothetical protein G4B88_018527 [Cannabis sativa]